MDRIVITGMGVLSPAGLTLEEFWNTLVSAKPVYGPLPEWADDRSVPCEARRTAATL